MSGVAHEDALGWAASARSARDGLLEDLRAGRTDLRAALALALDDPFVGYVRLLPVLEALPGARKVDTRRRLAELGIDGRTSLDALGPSVAATLLAAFPLSAAPSAVGGRAGDGAGPP